METVYLMDQMRDQSRRSDATTGLGSSGNMMPDHMTPDSWLSKIEEKLGPTVFKIEQATDPQTGQVDFRKLTGAEAMAYLNAINVEPRQVN